MADIRTGVQTVPGFLTHFLNELDLSRRELAQRLGLSVRTIHNIEHGRKRVDARVLDRLAAHLNWSWATKYPAAEPLPLMADHFISCPDAIAKVFLQTIMLNRADMLFLGDDPVVSPNFRWSAPGSPQAIPFAGDYPGLQVQKMLDRMHQTVQIEAIDDVQIAKNCADSTVTVRTVTTYKHPLSRNALTFKAYVDIDMTGNKLGVIDSTYDTGLISEFLQSGVAPRPRHSADL